MEKEREKEIVELPQVHVPDEFTQVTGPEIGITTTESDPASHPNSMYGWADSDLNG